MREREEKSKRDKIERGGAANSFYLHYEDVTKMALVSCGIGLGSLLIEG